MVRERYLLTPPEESTTLPSQERTHDQEIFQTLQEMWDLVDQLEQESMVVDSPPDTTPSPKSTS